MPSAQLSLYLDLEQGELADLEVVAKAALAFSAALREAIYVIDPSTGIKIELVSGTEGSLSLNSLISAVKNQNSKITNRSLGALMLLAAGWFGPEVAAWGLGKTMDFLLEQVQGEKTYTKEEVEEIIELATKASKNEVAKERVGDIFKELAKDSAVKGVGVTPKPGKKPDHIISRNEFPVRSGEPLESAVTDLRRTSTTEEKVRLISPVLVSGPRRWRFSGRTGEFGAPIRDVAFLESMANGALAVPLASGIEMDVMLETTEVRKKGVWEIIERNIISVIKVYPPVRQASLSLPPPPIPKKKPTNDKKDN
ncbi:hypothetical protein IGS68_31630 (plasmid) [Skermanella sp. TT6]|uniref:Uncharacterized protein n=1 Tax=Skermanella cutis TaxID=2775420 RepID=A0ABX7BGR7_9PROT|nr:hypothetical protein [Skermanella sp. TT6]QQP93578.1 hypothetical protein IGS68_31630 [Skermanella sp. TT6]